MEICICEIFQWVIVIGILYLTYLFVEKRRRRAELNVLIQQRRSEQELNFEWARKNFEKLDTKLATEITGLAFEQLRGQLSNGKIRPTDALKAYQRKAMEAHEKTNCLCLFIEESLDIAEKLEDNLKDPNYKKPALFGVPVSIKESIHVKHLDSTQGYANNLHNPSKSHSTSVQQLIRLGAIPFVHTNVPQALLSFGCCNPVYGSTTNPLDSTRVPGGSSGGEAALVSLGGSPLGIGTDVGGSVRTPATFCGVVGFKSSFNRSPQMGKVASIPGRQLLVSVEGPIAPTVDVCVEYLKLKWNDEQVKKHDVYMPPVNWQQDLYESEKKLTIGYYTFDGYQTAPPAYRRAVLDTVAVLRQSGHTLVEFEVPNPFHMFEIFCAGATADGGRYVNRSLDNDIVPPECYIGFPVTRLPYLLQDVISKFLPYPRMKGVLRALPRDTEDMRFMHAYIEQYRDDFVTACKEKQIDAIVCPAFGTLPPHHGAPNKMISATSYTALYNLIDFAAGTVPISIVSARDDSEVGDMKTSDEWDKLIKEESANCKGLPVSVQIATPPYREETCLRLLKEVEMKIGLRKSNE